jgi:translocation and assembly module TamA
MFWRALILILFGLFSQTLYAERALQIEVTIEDANRFDTPNNFSNRLKQDLALSHLKDDRYPAQTDFLFQQATKQLRQSLKAYGFYSPTIEPQLTRNENTTRANFRIQLNAQVRWRDIQIEISDEQANPLLWQNYRQFDLSLKSGNPLRHADYEQTLTDLLNLAHNQGYLDAHFRQRRFEVSPSEGFADAFIELELADPYQFGQVQFKGSQQISKDLLTRFVDFAPQTSYRQSELSQMQRALINSRYFARVQINPQFDEIQQRQIPIEVELEDNLPHRYKIGAGFGSDTGARLLLGFENRLVNQDGHRYEVESVIGERAQSFFINYGIPGQRPARQRWNIRTGWEATQSSNLNRSRVVFAPEYSYQPDEFWLIKPYFSLESERFRYTNQTDQTTRLLLGGLDIQKRYANDETYPVKGYRYNLNLRASSDQLFSDSQFFQAEASAKWIASPVDFWRWLLYANITQTATDQASTIPASYRYLLGGETLRGFGFESIGVLDENNQLQGGVNKLHASIETDYRFSKYLGLALFSDVGQVYNDQLDEDLKVGAGGGIRGFTPIGIVRFDIAQPISEPDPQWRLHFSIGLDL